MSQGCVHRYESVNSLLVDFCIDSLTHRRETIDFCVDCQEILAIHGESSLEISIPSTGECQHPHDEVTTEMLQVTTMNADAVLHETPIEYCSACQSVPTGTTVSL